MFTSLAIVRDTPEEMLLLCIDAGAPVSGSKVAHALKIWSFGASFGHGRSKNAQSNANYVAAQVYVSRKSLACLNGLMQLTP